MVWSHREIHSDPEFSSKLKIVSFSMNIVEQHFLAIGMTLGVTMSGSSILIDFDHFDDMRRFERTYIRKVVKNWKNDQIRTPPGGVGPGGQFSRF
jgi:hypothetical protein